MGDICPHPLPSFLDLRVLKDKSCYHLFGPSLEEVRPCKPSLRIPSRSTIAVLRLI